ncbi:type 12 methyltransferase [Oleiphilus messinensis]|uniref:Type 12 methyltransferase n=1 Tax=Oleiphilus messinensis TaxID=141451 RepID=A0A1Y0ICI6_9GAMM|nr:hypothetical protein [Oleiphilus messinensis]ARU57093.1 type 12 methyltransferase [Oleiphilus messinensis]
MYTELAYVGTLAEKGGPEQVDYPALDAATQNLFELKSRENYSHVDDLIRDAFGTSELDTTIHKLLREKSNQHQRNIDIVDRVCGHKAFDDLENNRWDSYFFSQPVVRSLRNRTGFLKAQLERKSRTTPFEKALAYACGTTPELYAFLRHNPDNLLLIECTERNRNALLRAKNRCSHLSDRLTFSRSHVHRIRSGENYSFIWSTSLFDQGDDLTCSKELKRLINRCSPGGEILISCFAETNPSRAMMSVFGWHAAHRSQDQLLSIAQNAGAERNQISIERDAEDSLYYLHIYR